MQRALPLLIFLGITLVAMGSAVGVNTVAGSMISPTDEEMAQLEAGTPSAGSENAPATADRARRQRVKTEAEYLDMIMRRNIFDPDAIATWNPKSVTDGGPGEAVTDLKVRLVGTMVAEPETYSAAFIVDENGKDSDAKGYSIGHKLHDAEIIKIEKLRVTIKRGDGKVEVLTVSEEAPKARPASSRPSSSGDGDGRISQTGDNEFSVDRSLIEEHIGDLEGISKMGRALLHRGPDGEFDGYRLSAIRRNTLADQLGIKNGDIVHSVNGQSLNSVQNAMGAYQGLQTESELTFEITRRGQPVTLKYNIQ